MMDATNHRGVARNAGGRGFTLVETALATVIIGTGVLAMISAQQVLLEKNNWSTMANTATLLGNEIREMTLNLPRHDPVTGTAFWGPEPDEVDVEDFDDVDDFDETNARRMAHLIGSLRETAQDTGGDIDRHTFYENLVKHGLLEVEDDVAEVEVPWLCAVQVRALAATADAKDIVGNKIVDGHNRLAVLDAN